jgi:hypothetical protein
VLERHYEEYPEFRPTLADLAIAAARSTPTPRPACAGGPRFPSPARISAVNKLGTVPLLLAGSEELKASYLTPVARGEAMFSLGPAVHAGRHGDAARGGTAAHLRGGGADP